MSRFINPQPQFILAGGELASGATMAFYETGTNDFKTIFADVNETTPIDNPITLGARGEVPDVFYSGTARVVAIDAEGTQIFDLDSVGTGGATGAYSIWDANAVYSEGDIVYGYDGYPYQSLVNENEGNDPTLNANNNANWTQLFRVTSYNAQVTYQPNDFVFYDGVIYRSVSSDNNANDPSTDGAANWVSVADARYVVYDNSSSGLTSLTGQAAIDELKNLIDNQPSSVVYRGQLDVSSGDAALPPSPTNGDLYVIAVSGTITLSVAGAAPTATAVNVGQQIIYNGTAMQWDLIAQIQQAASVSYSNITSGLAASDVQSALDEIEGRVDNTESNTTQNANNIGGLDSRLLSAEGTLSANGDVVTKNVVSSNTDTTNDRVVTTGWLNQGLTGALPASSDLHSEDINGITVRITIATANRPFENGVAKIHVYDSNNRVIQAYATDQNLTARKRYLNGVWQAWEYDVVSYATTAELQSSLPNKTGQRAENRERANAQYVLAADGYTALPGDVTAANGRVWELQIDGPANVLLFGAVADWDGSTGTDNYQAFMDAKDRASHVFVPDGSYAYSRGLRMDKFDFKWECESPATLMYCTGNAGAFTRWPEYSSVIMGTYTTANIGRNTKYSLNSVTVGESVTLSTPSDDSNFNIGDVVFITSTSTYTIGSETRPIWGQLNEVTGVSSGVISLKYVTEETGSAEISNMTSGTSSYILADGTDTGTANFASKNVEIIGGTWVNGKEEAPFSGGGGSLNCVVDIHSSECRNGPAYGNLYGYCSIRVNSEYDRKSPVELAYCSHGNNVDIVYSGVINPTTLSTTSDGFVWINESSRGNSVNITSANSASFDTDSLIKFTASRNNSVKIGSTYGENITESVIDFQDAAYTGVRPNTENNTACIMNNFADAPSGIRFRGNGQEGKNTASLNSAGSHTQALYFDSSSGSKVINSSIPSGGVLMSSSSNVCVHDSYIGDGLIFGGDADSEISGSFSGIETDSSRLLKGCSLISLTSNATNASPYTKTRTVAAGALNEMDKISIELDCFIPSGASADNKTFTLSFAGTNILNRVTTATNDEVMIRGCITYANNTAAIANFIVYGGNAVVDTRVLTIGGLDLASNSYDIVMTVTPTNVSDTLNIRNYRIKPYSANAGEF